jgi:hypothetical protein
MDEFSEFLENKGKVNEAWGSVYDMLNGLVKEYLDSAERNEIPDIVAYEIAINIGSTTYGNWMTIAQVDNIIRMGENMELNSLFKGGATRQ